LKTIGASLNRISEFDIGDILNNLTTFPLGMCKLANLKVISLCSNQISSLPGEIGMLYHLRWLSLPEEFESLTQLKTLGLGCSLFTTFPTVVLELKQLQELRLNNNYLTSIPPHIENLRQLKLSLMTPQVQKSTDQYINTKKHPTTTTSNSFTERLLAYIYPTRSNFTE